MEININDLRKVSGIGEKTIQRIKEKFREKPDIPKEVKDFTPDIINNCELYKGDCLEVMDYLIKQGVKVDAVITDPPYGTTACKWDSVIPFDEMWLRLKALRKDNTPIVLFGSEPFSSALRMSNIDEYKYDWYWDKQIPSGMSYAKYQPMRQIETISVFASSKTNYYPIKIKREKSIKGGGMSKGTTTNNQNLKALKNTYTHKNPTTLLFFKKVRRNSVHPTQKPVDLLEYLIRTYTKDNETVLDFTMGSGTTGVACIKTNRNFIGIELDKQYYEIAKKRIQEESSKPKQKNLMESYNGN